jgi:uncharacterized protein (TIGR02246 family)
MPVDSARRIESEVRAAFEASAAAWNRGDLDAYLEGYLDSDRTRYVSSGVALQGKAAIAAAYRARFASPERMGTLRLTRLEISVLSETDALIYGELDHTLGDQTSVLACTLHMRRAGGAWRMALDHTSALG